MISLQNITKKFGEKTAVNNVSFDIKPGEVVGFLGPNGAGKTTTMRVLTGFYKPDNGKVILNFGEKDLTPESVEARRQIGYLPEGNPLYPEMKVGEYLEFIATIKNKFKTQMTNDKSNSNDKIQNSIIKECGIIEVLNQPISELSRGYKQRVGLAAAIIGDPKILILDEPTSGLDPNQQEEMYVLLKKLSQDKTIILSTHILSEVEKVCSRVIIINKGKIVLDESVGKTKGRLEKKFREATKI